MADDDAPCFDLPAELDTPANVLPIPPGNRRASANQLSPKLLTTDASDASAFHPSASAASFASPHGPHDAEEAPARSAILLAPQWSQTKVSVFVDAAVQHAQGSTSGGVEESHALAAALRRAELAEAALVESTSQNERLKATLAAAPRAVASDTPYQDLREERLRTQRLEAELADVRAKLLEVESFKANVLGAVRGLKREVADLVADATVDAYGQE